MASLKDLFGSAPRHQCDRYAKALENAERGEETESQRRERERLADTLPGQVRRMVEDRRY